MQLNQNLIDTLRARINRTSVYAYKEEYRKRHNLICVVLDRLDSSVNYLNKNDSYPDSEENFMVYIMFANMIIDGVELLLKELLKSSYKDDEGREFFEDVFRQSALCYNNAAVPTDRIFFKYIRALVFAHPYATNYQSFIKKSTTHYSPWVICNRRTACFQECTDSVGMRIYISDRDDLVDFRFSFSILSKFVNYWLNKLKVAIDFYDSEYKQLQYEWKQHKINIDKAPIKVLKDIVLVLNERCIDNEMNDLLLYMETDYNEINGEIIQKYRHEIVNSLPKIVESINELDNLKMECLVDALKIQPKATYQMFTYHMEKILPHIDERQIHFIEYMGLISFVEAYANEFAKKWVNIDTNTMSWCEIRLLITVANYFEAMEQQKGEMVHDKLQTNS